MKIKLDAVAFVVVALVVIFTPIVTIVLSSVHLPGLAIVALAAAWRYRAKIQAFFDQHLAGEDD